MSTEYSLCIPTMRRWEFLKINLPRYLANKYVMEIVICDETGEDYDMIVKTFPDEPKIKVYKNEQRLGPFLNKLSCMQKATCDWICLMDSDNFADTDYFDALLSYSNGNLSKDTVYCPSFAKPSFDYTSLQGITISASSLQMVLKRNKAVLETSFNTGNYCINKHCVNIITSLVSTDKEVGEISRVCFPCDVIYMNYLLLTHCCSFLIVPNMYYQHVVHNGSIYVNTCNQYAHISRNVHEKFNSIGK